MSIVLDYVLIKYESMRINLTFVNINGVLRFVITYKFLFIEQEKQNESFQFDWFRYYNSLAYSELYNSCFCEYCAPLALAG